MLDNHPDPFLNWILRLSGAILSAILVGFTIGALIGAGIPFGQEWYLKQQSIKSGYELKWVPKDENRISKP